MPEEEAQIRVPLYDQGTISFGQLDKNTRDRFQRSETLIYYVLVVVAITLVAVVVGVAALIMDQLHFNNQFYQNGNNLPTKVEVKEVPKPVFVKPAGSP